MALHRSPKAKAAYANTVGFSIFQCICLALLTRLFIAGKAQPYLSLDLALVAVSTIGFVLVSVTTLHWTEIDLSSVALFVAVAAIDLYGLVLAYAIAYSIYGIEATSSSPSVPKPDSFDYLYFSGVTWTTIGYGDFVPSRGLSRFFAVLEALNSYLFLGVFIAVLLSMFSKFKVREDRTSGESGTTSEI